MQFMEEVLKRNIHDIEKAVKKNENKLRNLALMLRDKK